MSKRFYITTAIDYVNGQPHLGHAYEKVITDVIARSQRSLGKEVFFLTGTDEHGQKVQQAAIAEGKPPQQYCDELAAVWKDFAKKLNLSKIPCIEVKGQCAGFLYGMQISNSLILTGIYKKILLIGAEVHTCLFPYEPLKPILEGTNEEISRENYEFNTKFRDRMVLFGDGAGAFLMEKGSDGEGILDSLLYTDGNFIEKLYIKAGGSKSRPYFSKKDYEDGSIIPILEGREVYKLAVTLMTEVVLEILEKNGLKISDIDLLLMHQANLRINEAVQKRLGLPNEKVYNNIQKYGNTTAATLPLVYYEAKKEGKIKKGDLVCFVALGSGLHWGALLYKE